MIAGVPGTLVRVQLLGQFPQWLAENAARAVELGSWGVDLNCGCPSKTVNGSGGGATLLKDPELIYQGAKAMREAVPAHLPVSVKVRLDWDSGEKKFEIADAVQQAGATELVVHGRTKEQGYRAEHIDWQAIGEIRQRLNIPGKCFPSTFYRRINAGDRKGACEAIRWWIKDGGRDCRIRSNNCYGQVSRRDQESALACWGIDR